jgi:hypothetical protein
MCIQVRDILVEQRTPAARVPRDSKRRTIEGMVSAQQRSSVHS